MKSVVDIENKLKQLNEQLYYDMNEFDKVKERMTTSWLDALEWVLEDTVEWISVKDKLPEGIDLPCKDRKLYLVVINGKVDILWWNDGFYYKHGTMEIYVDATHWMPLPEPPTE